MQRQIMLKKEGQLYPKLAIIKDFESPNGCLKIEYQVTDDSFSHDFGYERVINHEIVSVFVRANRDAEWIEITDCQTEAKQLLEKAVLSE